jgi:8-oxo-dGTP diphosphatase
MAPSTSIILENEKGEVLLMLRDDKPTIQFPNQWVLVGGAGEEGETPEDGIRRELMEELELQIDSVTLFKRYEWQEKTEYVYHARVTLDSETQPLHEGQRVQYFSKSEIETMTLAFHDNEILRDFFASRAYKII